MLVTLIVNADVIHLFILYFHNLLDSQILTDQQLSTVIICNQELLILVFIRDCTNPIRIQSFQIKMSHTADWLHHCIIANVNPERRKLKL